MSHSVSPLGVLDLLQELEHGHEPGQLHVLGFLLLLLNETIHLLMLVHGNDAKDVAGYVRDEKAFHVHLVGSGEGAEGAKCMHNERRFGDSVYS